MTESEILIAVKTALESGGLDAASAKITELKTKTEEATAASGAQALAVDKLAQKTQAAGQVAQGLMSAAKGSIGGVTQALGGLSRMLGTVGAQAGLVFASFGVGWKIGSMIREKFVEPLLPVPEIARSIRDQVREAVAELQKLSQQKLDALKAEMDGVRNAASEAADQISRAHRMARAESEAIVERDVAQVEASMPAGPERDRRVAAIRQKAAEEEARAEAGRVAELQRVSDQTIESARDQLKALQESVRDAEAIQEMWEKQARDKKSELATRYALEAQARTTAAETTLAEASPDLQRTIAREQARQQELASQQRVAQTRLETAGARTTVALSGADASEQAERDRQARADLTEKERALREAERAAKAGRPDLDAAALREQSDVDSARSRVGQLDRSGRIGGGLEMRRAREALAREEAEAAAAIQAAADAVAANNAAVKALAAEVAQLKSQTKMDY